MYVSKIPFESPKNTVHLEDGQDHYTLTAQRDADERFAALTLIKNGGRPDRLTAYKGMIFHIAVGIHAQVRKIKPSGIELVIECPDGVQIDRHESRVKKAKGEKP